MVEGAKLSLIDNQNFNFSVKSSFIPSDDLLLRLIRFYKIASASYSQPEGSMWGSIANLKTDVHEALIGGDLALLRQLLMNPMSTNLYFGMDTLAIYNQHAFDENVLQPLIQKQIEENFLNLCEISGAKRFWNYEVNPVHPLFDFEEQIRNLETTLGFVISFPNPFPLEYGLVSSRGIIGHRVPAAIYHSLKVRELTKIVNGNKIVEIGGGV